MKYTSETPAKTATYAIFAAGILMVAFSVSCTSKPKSKVIGSDENAVVAGEKAAAQRGGDPGINLQCVMDHIQNPADSFHYSYRKDASDHVVQEADVTPQTIDGSFTNE